jgi:hypothetical protein
MMNHESPIRLMPVASHCGATHGQETTLRMVPGHDFAVTVLTNCDEGGTLTDEIYKLALKVYLGILLPEVEPLEMGPAQVAPYLGYYEAYGGDADLTWKDGQLILQAINKGHFPTPESPASPNPPAVRMAFFAQDRAILLDEPYKDSRVEFQRSPDGQVDWMRLSGRIHLKRKDAR